MPVLGHRLMLHDARLRGRKAAQIIDHLVDRRRPPPKRRGARRRRPEENRPEAAWRTLLIIAILAVVLDLPLLMLLYSSGLVQATANCGSTCLDALTYRRQLGVRLFFGEETDLRVEVTNAKPLPFLAAGGRSPSRWITRNPQCAYIPGSACW